VTDRNNDMIKLYRLKWFQAKVVITKDSTILTQDKLCKNSV